MSKLPADTFTKKGLEFSTKERALNVLLSSGAKDIINSTDSNIETTERAHVTDFKRSVRTLLGDELAILVQKDIDSYKLEAPTRAAERLKREQEKTNMVVCADIAFQLSIDLAATDAFANILENANIYHGTQVTVEIFQTIMRKISNMNTTSRHSAFVETKKKSSEDITHMFAQLKTEEKSSDSDFALQSDDGFSDGVHI